VIGMRFSITKECSLKFVDNTNPDVEVRKTWISLAKKFKVYARCIQFTMNVDLAKHNDVFRALSGLAEVYLRTIKPTY
jgi:hypothetical protein